MNFLAHLYLSGNNKNLKIGNFIADSVKGKSYKRFSPEIQKGIILHRAIDSFTDHNEFVNESKQKLRKIYGKHAGVVIDIFYDYFLSIQWKHYSDTPISQFIKDSYIIIMQNFLHLPLRVQTYLPFMVVNNWLEKYGQIKGIERVLNGMSKYSSLPNSTNEAIVILNEQHYIFKKEFDQFFPLIIEMTKTEFGVIYD